MAIFEKRYYKKDIFQNFSLFYKFRKAIYKNLNFIRFINQLILYMNKKKKYMNI